ncbi:uncharacterized protein LOC143233610 isoform X2 [Tachypleus tridentatus]|uniref:uncharacterized protein LOC143233610 isoform X2 n=1 Tax=Tachypleus tridentatus TaxID=6853 RepID=UPI003FCFB0D0
MMHVNQCVMVTCCKQFYTFVAIVGIFVLLYKSWVYLVRSQFRVDNEPAENHDKEVSYEKDVSGYSICFSEWQLTFKHWVHDYWHLRQINHGLFCAFTCFALMVLAAVGHFVPDIIIVSTLVMVVSLGPGLLLFVVSTSWFGTAKELFGVTFSRERSATLGENLNGESTDNESELDEFLPPPLTDSIAMDLSLSEDRGNNKYPSNSRSTSSLTQHDTEEFESMAQELGIEALVNEDDDSSLIQGLGNFPDVHDESEDDIEVHLPTSLQKDTIQETQHHHAGEREFSSSSESEEENIFAKGLAFSEVETLGSSQKPLAATQQSLLVNSGLNVIDQLRRTVQKEILSNLGLFKQPQSQDWNSRSRNKTYMPDFQTKQVVMMTVIMR